MKGMDLKHYSRNIQAALITNPSAHIILRLVYTLAVDSLCSDAIFSRLYFIKGDN